MVNNKANKTSFVIGHSVSEEVRKKLSKAFLGKKRGPFSSDVKENMRAAAIGKKMPMESLYKNMKAHLAYDVTLEWLKQFEDIEKLKFLNKSIVRDRDRKGFDTATYISFIEKFYTDEQFNKLYQAWISTKDKWIKPSLDHIIPKSKSGSLSIDNLQFISWFENRAKVDMSLQEWDVIKSNISYYLGGK